MLVDASLAKVFVLALDGAHDVLGDVGVLRFVQQDVRVAVGRLLLLRVLLELGVAGVQLLRPMDGAGTGDLVDLRRRVQAEFHGTSQRAGTALEGVGVPPEVLLVLEVVALFLFVTSREIHVRSEVRSGTGVALELLAPDQRYEGTHAECHYGNAEAYCDQVVGSGGGFVDEGRFHFDLEDGGEWGCFGHVRLEGVVLDALLTGEDLRQEADHFREGTGRTVAGVGWS